MEKKANFWTWGRSITAIAIISLLYNMGTTLMISGVPLYFDSLGAPATLSGVVATSFSLAGMFACLISGWLCARFGARRVMIFAFLAYGILTYLFGVFTALAALIVVRTLAGSCYAFSMSSCTTACSDVSPRERLSQGMGIVYVGQSVAIGFGAVILVWLTQKSYSPLFLSSACVFLAAALITLLCRFRSPASPESAKFPKLNELLEKKAIPSAIVNLVLNMVYGGIISFVLVFTNTRNIPNGSLFFLCGGVTMVLSNLILPKIADRKDPMLVFLPSQLFSVASFVILMFAHSTGAVIAAGVCYGVNLGAALPVMNAIALNKADAGRESAAASTFQIGANLGVAIGSTVWGVIIDNAGYVAAFSFAAIGMVVAGILYVVLIGRKKA